MLQVFGCGLFGRDIAVGEYLLGLRMRSRVSVRCNGELKTKNLIVIYGLGVMPIAVY